MRRDVDDRLLTRKCADPVQGLAGCPLVWGHSVDRPLEHKRLGVGGVPGEEHQLAVLLKDDRDMALGVPGRSDDLHVAGLGQTTALWEWSEGLVGKLEEARREPRGRAMRQEATHLAHEAARVVELRAVDEDLALWEMRQTAAWSVWRWVMITHRTSSGEKPIAFSFGPISSFGST